MVRLRMTLSSDYKQNRYRATTHLSVGSLVKTMILALGTILCSTSAFVWLGSGSEGLLSRKQRQYWEDQAVHGVPSPERVIEFARVIV